MPPPRAPATDAGTGAPAPSAPTPAAPITIGGTLEILSAGADPKFALKYAPIVGAKQSMELVTDTAMKVPAMNGVVMPQMIMRADVTVLKVEADGKITSRVTFTDIQLKPTNSSMRAAASVMMRTLNKIKGKSATMTIEPNGRLVSIMFGSKDPVIAPIIEQTRQSLSQMVVQLPDKPVGRGGKWQVKQTIEQEGAKAEQTSVFEVVALTDKTAKLKLATTISAGSQTIDPRGARIELEKMEGKGMGSLDLEFTSLVPTADTATDIKATIKPMGPSKDTTSLGLSVDASMSMKMKIRPR